MGVEPLEPRCLLDAKLLVTEFSAANDNGIRDEDGDRSDWIELYNAGDESANLDGWFLTDDPDQLNKWRLPPTSLDPGAYEVIFASGKDRADSSSPLHTSFKLGASGEYLALVNPDGQTVASEYAPAYPVQIDDYSFGMQQEIIDTTVVVAGAASTAFIPTDSSLGTRWTEFGFDDSEWLDVTAGVGFGRTAGFSDLVGTDPRFDMLRARTGSVYIRVPFVMEDLGRLSSAVLRMKYDDGFVAYLNGREVARRNGPEILEWNSEASRSHDNEAAIVFEDIDITEFLSELQPGENVLAIQGLNLARTDADFLIVPELAVSRPGEVDIESRRFFAFPSPGLPNGAAGTSMYVDQISHSPNVPNNDEDLIVTASVFSLTDEDVSLTLNYRVMYGVETQLPMFDDGLHADGVAGDGTYGATIPAGVASAGQMIRYYVTAEQTGSGTSRWPNFHDPLDSEEYLGTVVHDPQVGSSNLPLMQLFMEDPSRADTRAGTRGSLFYAGEFYDNVGIDLHGRGSVSFPKKSYDVDFNRDHRFNVSDDVRRVKNINLITNFADRSMMRTTLVNEAVAATGAGGHLAFQVRTQLNGEFYAVYDVVEEPDERFLERIGRDPNGALYKMIDPVGSTDNGLKQTRKFEGKADLQALINGIRRPPGQSRAQFLYDNVNIPEMASFLAILDIVVHSDCCFTNYYLYRDTSGNGEWEAFPFDVDLTMGNWVFQEGLRIQESIYRGRGNSLFSALLSDPSFDQMYLRRLRTLMDEIYGPPGSTGRFEERIDELVQILAPDARLDNAKWPPWGSDTTWEEQVSVLRDVFVPGRREFLYGQTIPFGGPIPDAQPSDAELTFGRVEASPESGNQDEEFIELTNPNDYAIDISGWSLAGDVDLQFKLGTVIPSGGSLYVSPNVNAFRSRATGPSGGQGLFVQGAYAGRLSNSGGTLSILDPTGRVAASTEFTGEPTPAEQFLRITELMYNPPAHESDRGFDNDDFEFVELRNTSATTPVDLSNVQISGGVRFDFSHSNAQQLKPGQFVLVVKDRVAFEARYGTGLPIAGEFDGNLSNGGERILLEQGGTVVLNFEYRDEWYPSTDGIGRSLVIVNEFAAPAEWNEKPSWRPSAGSSGSPAASDVRIAGDANGDGRFDSSDLVQVFQAGEFEDGVDGNSIFEDGDWNGDGDFDSADLVLALQLGMFFAEARVNAGGTTPAGK